MGSGAQTRSAAALHTRRGSPSFAPNWGVSLAGCRGSGLLRMGPSPFPSAQHVAPLALLRTVARMKNCFLLPPEFSTCPPYPVGVKHKLKIWKECLDLASLIVKLTEEITGPLWQGSAAHVALTMVTDIIDPVKGDGKLSEVILAAWDLAFWLRAASRGRRRGVANSRRRRGRRHPIRPGPGARRRVGRGMRARFGGGGGNWPSALRRLWRRRGLQRCGGRRPVSARRRGPPGR